MSHTPIHSTGRGGAGNVGPDPVEYADAGIVREGVQGVSGEPEYSSGRGGAGNIVDSPKVGAIDPRRSSQDVIPEASLRPAEGHEDFHTGRGGQGNVHKEKYGGHSHDPNKHKPNIIEKVKDLLHHDKDGEHKSAGGS